MFDPATLSALSTLPQWAVMLWLVVQQMQEQKTARADFLSALAAERAAIVDVSRGLQEIRVALERLSSVVLANMAAELGKKGAARLGEVAEGLHGPTARGG